MESHLVFFNTRVRDLEYVITPAWFRFNVWHVQYVMCMEISSILYNRTIFITILVYSPSHCCKTQLECFSYLNSSCIFYWYCYYSSIFHHPNPFSTGTHLYHETILLKDLRGERINGLNHHHLNPHPSF